MQCFSPMVVVKNRTDSNRHNQKRCSVSIRKKHKYTCLNVSCLEHSWTCSEHADDNRPLTEAHYKEFSIWGQHIPAQTFKNQRDSKLDQGKPVVLQGFPLCYSYQCPSLEGQSPKQLTNQQTSAIPVNPNNPSGGHYTQNYPREIPPVSCIYIAISYLLILI